MNSGDQTDGVTTNRARLLAVLGVIASSIGIVGFVAVVGGMVVWLRFDAFHLPADTVVASMPRTDLVVIGLSTLIPFIVLGLIAVLLAYVFAVDNLVPSIALNDLASRWSGVAGLEDIASGQKPASRTQAAAAPEDVDSARTRLTQIAQEAISAAAAAQAAGRVGLPKAVKEERSRITELANALDKEFGSLRELESDDPPPEHLELKDSLDRTARLVAESKAEAQRAAADAHQRRKRARLTRVLSVLGLVLAELVIVFIAGAPSTAQVLGLVAIAVMLALITLLLGFRTQGFALFGAAIFISVLLFGTVTTLWRTYHEPKVQPAAILRAGADPGLTGYFVAQTSDRIYLVRILGERRGSHFQSSFPRFVVVPQSNVVAMEVGPLQTAESAYGTSYAELQELCAQKVPDPTTRSTSGSKNAARAVRCGQQH